MNPQELQLMVARARREQIRWFLLLTMNLARPTDATLSMLLGVVRGTYPDATELEVRRELDYLVGRELASIRVDPLEQVRAKLERYGIDVVEYTVDCDPGMARPKAVV